MHITHLIQKFKLGWTTITIIQCHTNVLSVIIKSSQIEELVNLVRCGISKSIAT